VTTDSASPRLPVRPDESTQEDHRREGSAQSGVRPRQQYVAPPRSGQVQRWVLDKMGRPAQLDARKFTWDASGNLIGPKRPSQIPMFSMRRPARPAPGRQNRMVLRLPARRRPLWRQGPAGKRWFAYLPDASSAIPKEHGIHWLVVSLPGTDRPLAFAVQTARCTTPSRRIGSVAKTGRPQGAGHLRDGLLAGLATSRVRMWRTGSACLPAWWAMRVSSSTRAAYYDPQIVRFISIDP